MAAPAQPKKIVAPTVSQINAEFVTQVSSGRLGVCVCSGVRTSRPRDLEWGILLDCENVGDICWLSYSLVFLLGNSMFWPL